MAVVGLILFVLSALSAFGDNPFKLLTNQIPKTSIHIENFESCPEYPDTPIKFNDLVISQTGHNKFILSGKINITEKMSQPLNLLVEMYRCSSKHDRSSCEYYFTFKKDKICDLLEKDDNTWDYFTDGTNLPSTCPFPPGSYTMNGSTIDLKEMKWVPFFQSHWRLKNNMFQDETKRMFCLISEFTLERSRN